MNLPRSPVNGSLPEQGSAPDEHPERRWAATIEEAAEIRRGLDSLDPAGRPQVRAVCGAMLPDVRRLAVFPGSFNPPHVAHLALLESGVRAASADAGAFLLSVRTVDKEQVTGMLLEDRLWLLCQLVQSSIPLALGVLASNRGLYLDMAVAVRGHWPGIESVWFVVGYDKLVQIFDRRYYADREAALVALFTQASLLVAPRDEHTLDDVAALLAQPENRRYAGGVTPMPLDPALAHVSSTSARRAASGASGDDPTLPEVVRRFIAETGCYWDEERYAGRAQAIAARAARAR